MWARGLVAIATALGIVVGGCGGAEQPRISLSVAQGLGRAVPSSIAWEVELDSPMHVVTAAGETLILTTDVEDRAVGLTTWRGGLLFEIDPSHTPWSRGPLLGVGGGRVLMAERRTDAPGDTWMVAFDLATGGQLWSVRLDRDDARPVIAGELVIVATRDNPAADLEGAVRAIELADGTERWTLPLDLAPDDRQDSGDYDGTTPVLTLDGEVLAVRTSSRAVTLVDVAEGRELGSFETTGELFEARPVASSDRVLVSEGADALTAKLHALDAATAVPVWSVDASESQMWVSGPNLVYVGPDGAYQAADLASGDQAWRAPRDVGWVIAESDGLLLTHELTALRASDGERAWSADARFVEQLWLTGGVVTVLQDGAAVARDLVTGEQRWSHEAATVVATVGESFLVAADDELVLREAASGSELWTLEVPERSFATAVSGPEGGLFISVEDEDEFSTTVLALEPPG